MFVHPTTLLHLFPLFLHLVLSIGQVTATGAIVSGRQTRMDAQGHLKKDASGASKRHPTAGAQFTTSLKILLEKMISCQAHFVRCIKPNTNQVFLIIIILKIKKKVKIEKRRRQKEEEKSGRSRFFFFV